MIVSPAGGILCNPILPLSSCAISSLGGDAAGSVAGAAAAGVVDALTSFLSDADSWLVGHISDLYRATPNLRSDWFKTAYESMERAFEVAVTPVLLIATIGSIVRQDLRRLARIWLVGVPISAVAAAGSVVLTDLGLKLSDSLTAFVVGGHLSVPDALQSLARNSLVTGTPALVELGVFALALFGAVLIWLELVLRSAAVYIAVFFLPLGMVTYVWPATAHFAKRSVEVVVALVLSKFVIFSSLWLGLSVLSGGNSIDTTLEAAGLLLLASFTPFALLKLIPVAEVQAIAHLEGVSRRPFHAASRAASTAAGPSHPVVQRVLAARGSSDTAPPESSQVTPQPLPVRKPDYVVSLVGETDG